MIRSDGSRIGDPTKNKAVLKEFGKLWALLKKPKVYLLIPILIGFNWNGIYQGIYLTNYFSVRSRALGALTSGVSATLANFFWGWFFDLKRFSRPVLAKTAWAFFATIMLALFAWQVANEQLYSTSPTKVTLDWATPGFGRAFAVNVLFRFMNESHYMFVYWIIGAFNNDLETLTLTVGIVRSFESIGSCLAYGIGAAKIPAMTNLIVAFVMFAICIPTTTALTFLVPEHPIDESKTLAAEVGAAEASDTEAAEVVVAAGQVDAVKPL